MNRLAIIIPAYKVGHLDKVFQCLKEQTRKDFSLYVFDDASPYDIKGCFDQFFEESENVHFHRFSENMGAKNLASHWNRCLSMSGDEEWVWNFSDDDIMTDNCVEEFYRHVDDPDVHDIMRFTLNGIRHDRYVDFPNPTVPVLSSAEFFCQLYTGVIDARMPEFVMRRRKLEEIGGFVAYDLAWRSDNATVMKMAYPHGIYNVTHGTVYWRKGTENISGRTDYNQRKNTVTVAFFNWVDDFFHEHGLAYTVSAEELMVIYARSFLPVKGEDMDGMLRNIASQMKLVNSPKRQQILMEEGKKSLRRIISIQREKRFFCFIKRHLSLLSDYLC